jgi:hypothetical protein
MEAVLANCYDQIKGFDSSLDVIAAGLSPRGNDDPGASSNSSISPVTFIAALGTAYRMSGRTAPLFDEWSWHCYPNIDTDEVETGYAWPNTGCVNAASVKLALWDAFRGTGQPLLAGYTPTTSGSTLFGNVSKMFIDETGWQVDTSSLPGYVNAENVPTTSARRSRPSITRSSSVAFSNGVTTSTVKGATARDKTTATAKAPTGFGSGTATVTLARIDGPGPDDDGDRPAGQRFRRDDGQPRGRQEGEGQAQAQAAQEAQEGEALAGTNGRGVE